ncbi:histidinol-phosphate transaminase [Cognatilysobacter bugurensis]|uniref:Histidinol-phosphate aminotransferase n=1 Tax=Cognatilysobacter bugurensis TaxID=543356 RepID=A0A918SW48_9GAMM|nr:histidinol-phosphate transaminase [Lysobacter bugurensis]GHA73511.1 histidinol-phosphate aminotransferase [Lysobacter bugurensis]
MSSPLDLVRADLRGFAGYKSARSDRLEGSVWLNANESAWANAGDDAGRARRYPDPQPAKLRATLAELYGCAPEQLLVGRGSDEAIDLLVRALCRPGDDAILTTPPTFGMYAVNARLHGTRVVEVPLIDDTAGWRCDFNAVGDAVEREGVRLVFLCSPGNPTGSSLPLREIEALATRLDGRALVVVDEAYGEYSESPSAGTLLQTRRNVAVLRTLSKAHALAGERIGTVIADAELIDVLRRCQAPYPLPASCVAAAERALEPVARAATAAAVRTSIEQRDRLVPLLGRLPGVRQVYPTRANFVLVRFDDAQRAFDRLLDAGIVVRDMRAAPGLGNALRISLGTPEQNEAVLDALAAQVTT